MRIMRIIPHIEDSIKSSYKWVVLLPNDTDVLIAVLHYTEDFTSIGFNELWMQFGTGKSKRFIPEHKLLIQSSPQLYSNFIKCNVLTETDSTRKVCTKFAALKSDPNEYLQNFGSDDCLETQFQNPEQFEIYKFKFRRLTIWTRNGKVIPGKVSANIKCQHLVSSL